MASTTASFSFTSTRRRNISSRISATPPYDEGIQWLILAEHPAVSAEQVVRLLLLKGGNARDVQPLGDRVVEGS